MCIYSRFADYSSKMLWECFALLHLHTDVFLTSIISQRHHRMTSYCNPTENDGIVKAVKLIRDEI